VQEHREVIEDPPRARSLEQIGAVLEMEPAIAVPVDRQGQVELGDPAVERERLPREIGEASARHRRIEQVQQDVHEWSVARIAPGL
jgi:hypothetical protein